MFQFTRVWKNEFPQSFASMALKKNSPYTMFFNKAIQSLKEKGKLSLYKQRHSKFTTSCDQPNEEGNQLGFLKTITIFAILSFGALLSIFYLLYECFRKPKNIVNSLSQEKINILFSQIPVMIEKFQNLRRIYQVPDPRFNGISGNENNQNFKNPSN